MAKALSTDLRKRVIAAVSGGMSCRQAADRFSVSASSAIRWCARNRETGNVRPQVQGGDRRSGLIEAHADMILTIVKAIPDVTLAELQERLNKQGLGFGIGTLWRFFDRRRISFKKSPPMRWSGIALTS